VSLHRRNPRRDQNEKEIVAALRQMGALVMRLSEKGAADLLCFHRGRLILLEVKTKAGKATEAQAASSALGWPVQTVRSVDDALFAITPVSR